jgi:glutamate-1-semialdehyde 2,1-aminomutase
MSYLAGGTNLSISFPSNYPRAIVRGEGPYVFDADGTRYTDLWMGYGALMFGHGDPVISQAVKSTLEKGWFFSYQTVAEEEFATLLHEVIPCAELVRFATSGSDAVAYSIRAARNYTGRQAVLALAGGYHGVHVACGYSAVHEDAASTVGTMAIIKPDTIPFNDAAALREALKSKPYAAFIIEPVMANNGCVPPAPGYLEAVRKLCTEAGTILIFDEVITGFRQSVGGAQRKFGVTPDIATFAKAIAGGMPLSTVVGKADIMNRFTPKGEVFHFGTFNGAPVAIAAAMANIHRLKDDKVYQQTDELREQITGELLDHAAMLELPVAIQGSGSMMSLALGVSEYKHGVQSSKASQQHYVALANYLAGKEHLLLPPLFTETIFLAPVHGDIAPAIIRAIKDGLTHVSNQPQN